MKSAKDYYEVLGVPRDADAKAIKKAYRKLAMKYHPDRNPGKEKDAGHRFKEINEAYAILGDPEKRKQYDQFGTVGDLGDIFASPYTRTTFEDVLRDYDGAHLGFGFLDDVFGEILRGGGGRGGKFSFTSFSGPGGGSFGRGQRIDLGDVFAQAQRQRQPQRSLQETRYEIAITAAQAASGLEKDLKRKGKKLRVKIPSGVKDGATIRLRGAKQITDGMPGDIIITVRVK